MGRDMNQSFPAAFCILTAGTVPAILSARYCRAVGAMVAVERLMISLSLLDFWPSSFWPRWKLYTCITNLYCSYYTISMAGMESNSPLLSAKQLSVSLTFSQAKNNFKTCDLSSSPCTEYFLLYKKNSTQTMIKDTSTSLYVSWSLKDYQSFQWTVDCLPLTRCGWGKISLFSENQEDKMLRRLSSTVLLSVWKTLTFVN